MAYVMASWTWADCMSFNIRILRVFFLSVTFILTKRVGDTIKVTIKQERVMQDYQNKTLENWQATDGDYTDRVYVNENQPFADWLATLHKGHGWQKTIAEIFRCTPAHIRSLAIGRRQPDQRIKWLTTKKLVIDQAIDQEPLGLSADTIGDWLVTNTHFERFDMIINSPGGDIYQCIAGMKEIQEDGGCNSCTITFAALGSYIIGLGAKKLLIHPKGLLHIGPCKTAATGTAQSLIETARLLDKTELKIIDIIQEKRGVDVAMLMAAEPDGTFLTAEEALEMGLVDEIVAGGAE